MFSVFIKKMFVFLLVLNLYSFVVAGSVDDLKIPKRPESRQKDQIRNIHAIAWQKVIFSPRRGRDITCGYIYMYTTPLQAQSKVIYPSNAHVFKDLARRFVPDVLANQIANLVYKSTTEREPSEEYTDDDDETDSREEESEYAEIHKRASSNRHQSKTVKINLNELVEKVREKLMNDDSFYPRILKRGNKAVVIHEEEDDETVPGGNGRQNGQAKHGLLQTKARQFPKQPLRERPENRERPVPAKTPRIIKQQQNTQKVDNDYEYNEPENVPAPKLKGKRLKPKSDLYETIKIKSKKKKDSYEDYVMPPREYDVFDTDEDNKGKNKRIELSQGQGTFIGETLGDETDVQPPKKKIINKKIQKRPIKPKVNKPNDSIRQTYNVKKKQNQQDYGGANNQQNYDDYDKPNKPKRGNRPDYDNEDGRDIRQQKPDAKKIIKRKPIKKTRNREPAYNDYDNNEPKKSNKAVQKAPAYQDYVQPESQKGKKLQPDYEEQYEKAVTKRGNKRQDDVQAEETTEYTEPTEVYVDENPQPTTPQDLKVRTEHIGDDEDDEVVKPGAHLNKGGARADLPSTLKQKKGTNIPTREIFTMSSPDYYNKQPKVAEKYNFEEPIPEGDREPENTKSWMGPPAKINGKVAAAG